MSTHPTGPVAPPSEAADRKAHPLATGCLDYFPDALLAVAHVSKLGNDQHNPGEPLHWAKHKSRDEADALLRHLLQRGTLDSDGVRHSAKVAWRALALLQREIEEENGWHYDAASDAWVKRQATDSITERIAQSQQQSDQALGRDAYRDRG